jgi:hypothetical protein
LVHGTHFAKAHTIEPSGYEWSEAGGNMGKQVVSDHVIEGRGLPAPQQAFIIDASAFNPLE